MRVPRILALAAPALAVLLLASSAFAAAPPATSDLAYAGDYCIACHSANDPRLTSPLAWNGSSTRDTYSPCPAVRELRQEIAYVDQAVDAIHNGIAETTTPDISSSAIATRLLAREQALPRLLDTTYRSLAAGVNEARTLRYALNKSYADVQTARQAWTREAMLVVDLAITLFLLVSLAWGWRNTRHVHAGLLSGGRIGIGALLFVLLVFVVFALPIFNPPATNADTATAQDLERQSALDAAIRAAVSAENESAKAWGLARLAATDTRPASLDLTTALSTTRELESNADAYWGEGRALEESAVTWGQAADAAPPVSQRIQTAASRVWTYAAMADELAASHPSDAQRLLASALARTPQEPDPYFRDLDLKKIAVAWQTLDRDQAATVAAQIQDPLVHAWALREMGQFDKAAAVARKVQDPDRRVFALREIAVASKNPAQLAQALTIAQALADPTARAYALSDLAAAWSPFDPQQAAQLANTIAAQFPDARASAYEHAGLFPQAWAETQRFTLGFEQARAQSEIVAAWAVDSPDDALVAALKINDPFWSAEAQRAAVAALARSDAARALDRARAVPIPFVRVQALTDVARVTHDAGTFRQAAALADDLHDAYPLRDLAVAWAPVEPTQALALVDKMDREADRAHALLAVALALAPSDHAQANGEFDRAVKQAQATRVAGDPLYSVELLRQLGRQYSTVDMAKSQQALDAALQAAQQVTTAF